MQKDFHFHAVGVLARAAGFPERDALTIAYASQYVDDATESELVKVKEGGTELRLDPVRTAHKGLELLGALEWSAQKRVYVPFHFLPPRRFDPANAKDFTFITEKGGELGKALLEGAITESVGDRRLCRIGIALHAYADTWSHHGFSGRQSRVENDVENIRVLTGTGAQQHPFMENVLLDALPQIGHAEAGYHPDLPYESWMYDSRRETDVARDNTREFLEAAKSIHATLVKIRGRVGGARGKAKPFKSWGELRADFERLFRISPSKAPGFGAKVTLGGYTGYHDEQLDERCRQWEQQYGSWFSQGKFKYSRTAWRNDALRGDTAWDEWSSREWDRMEPLRLKKGFWSSLWVHFHRAALRQRHWVLENLP
jgi:hypothetical protein